ncbi:glycosyltransferase [Gordonia sp. NPDC003376]
MKILHVLTALSPDGAFGGPARVAANQCAALRDRGNEVTLVAGAQGFDQPVRHFGGQPVTTFPARFLVPHIGYAALYAGGLRGWIRRHADDFDIAHVHLARDLVTFPAVSALRRTSTPYVVQPHGMITPNPNPLIAACDAIATRRYIAGAGRVLVLNGREREDLTGVMRRPLVFETVHNGVPATNGRGDDTAVSVADVPEVLFLARLHPRKRPAAFVHAAIELLDDGVAARFSVVGPEAGAEFEVDALIGRSGHGTSLTRQPGINPADTMARMAQASVYVLPAEREPFGMTIVEALSVGTPVVICSDGGLSSFVRDNRCGIVTDGSPGEIAAAVRALIGDPVTAAEMGESGRAAVAREFGMDTIAKSLEDIYANTIASQRRKVS